MMITDKTPAIYLLLAIFAILAHAITAANPSEFQCSRPGQNEYLCTTICNNDGTCEVDITMKKCSCIGEDLYIQKSVMHDIATGAQISASDGTHSMAKLCRNCANHCQQRNNPKVLIDEWKPWTIRCNNKKPFRGKRSAQLYAKGSLVMRKNRAYKSSLGHGSGEDYSLVYKTSNGTKVNKVMPNIILKPSNAQDAAVPEFQTESVKTSTEPIKSDDDDTILIKQVSSIESQEPGEPPESSELKPEVSEEYKEYDESLNNTATSKDECYAEKTTKPTHMKLKEVYFDYHTSSNNLTGSEPHQKKSKTYVPLWSTSTTEAIEEDLYEKSTLASQPSWTTTTDEAIEDLNEKSTVASQAYQSPAKRSTKASQPNWSSNKMASPSHANWLSTKMSTKALQLNWSTTEMSTKASKLINWSIYQDHTNKPLKTSEPKWSSTKMPTNKNITGASPWKPQDLGDDHLQRAMEKMAQKDPYKVITFPKCNNIGNHTISCRKICSEDKSTCSITVHLDKCTCQGVQINLKEKATYDMNRRLQIQTVAPLDHIYGTGYATKCGTCYKFCNHFPGEQRHRKSSSEDKTCAKNKY